MKAKSGWPILAFTMVVVVALWMAFTLGAAPTSTNPPSGVSLMETVAREKVDFGAGVVLTVDQLACLIGGLVVGLVLCVVVALLFRGAAPSKLYLFILGMCVFVGILAAFD